MLRKGVIDGSAHVAVFCMSATFSKQYAVHEIAFAVYVQQQISALVRLSTAVTSTMGGVWRGTHTQKHTHQVCVYDSFAGFVH